MKLIYSVLLVFCLVSLNASAAPEEKIHETHPMITLRAE